MTRFWTETTGYIIDAIGVGWFVLLVLLGSGLVAAGWQFFPSWLPARSWFRRSGPERPRRRRREFTFKLPRWRRRRERPQRIEPAVAAAFAADSLPDVSGDLLRARSEAFAAEGRFADAVRERLRAIVRDLVDAAIIPQHPDWTVTELARAAAEVNVALEPALAGATTIFSDIWYGQRPAHPGSDGQMRAHDAAIHEIVGRRSMVTR